MSMQAYYRKEREGVETIEGEFGFIAYKLFPEECYIVDIYVVPGLRRAKIATEMANEVALIAKNNKCKILTGSVDTRLASSSESAMALFGYGMRFLRTEGSVVFFYKEVG